jgi:uncharacterized membrane protein
MRKLILTVLILVLFTSPIYAQMSTGQGGGMMSNGWGWGMGFGFGWIFMLVIIVLVIFGVIYMMKRK